MRKLERVSDGSLKQRLNFTLFTSGHYAGRKGTRARFFTRRPSGDSPRQFLLNRNVVQRAQAILQSPYAVLENGKPLFPFVPDKKIFEKLACVTKLSDRDPQFVAPAGTSALNFLAFFIAFFVRRARISAADRRDHAGVPPNLRLRANATLLKEGIANVPTRRRPSPYRTQRHVWMRV